MYQLSDRLLAMEESATIAMAKKSRELKTQGKDVISLSLGEPDFNTPQFIKNAAIEALAQNYTTYTPVPGYDDLRESISKKFLRDNHLHYSKDQIVVSTGAKQSIANLVLSLINPGDEVIIPAPYWVSYLEIVKVAEGVPVIISAGIEKDFKITGADLEAAITPKTKLLMFSTPCNPTGSVYSKEELKDLARVLAKYPQIVAMSDEIYEHINFIGKHESLAQFEEIYDQVVTVNGVSKAWAMTGWRLGYIGAPKAIAQACDKIQGQFTSATSSITQRATIAAMEANPDVLKDMIAAFKSRRDLVLNGLKQIAGLKVNHPEGAFYVFADCSAYFGKKYQDWTISNSDDLCMYLLEEALVACVGGAAFGDPNCFRISYAASEDILLKAVNRIGSALAKLQ
jgi:aspartate aminotransferase